MAQRRVHFVDVPVPETIWLTAGVPATGVVPQARLGATVEAGAVVAGVEHTSTVAVTPLAGEVGQITPVIDSRGREREAVALAPAAGAAERAPQSDKPAALGAVTRDDLPAWIDRLERAGVRADRHNSPNLIAQLLAATRRPIDTIICHALEADPTLPLQAQWALRHPLELRDGLRLLARVTGARRTLLAVSEGDNRRLYRHLRRTSRGESSSASETAADDIAEGDSVMLPFEPAPEAAVAAPPAQPQTLPYERLRDRRAAARTPPQPLGLRIIPVRNAYPQADPTLLVWALLSRRLPPGRLPTDAGLIVLDAVAAVAVGSVARGARVIRREPIAVRDHRTDVSLLADVWRGTRATDLLRMLGFVEPAPPPRAPPLAPPPGLRGGDFLRNQPLPLDCVLDGGELMLHLSDSEMLPVVPEPCIRCGWCLDICPTHVHPAGVLEAAQRNDMGIAEQFGISACIECGLCSYICPSRLPLLEAARQMRREQPKAERT